MYDFIVVIEMPDGTLTEIVSREPVDVGSSWGGGKVIACRSLSKKDIARNPLALAGGGIA
jgi:hypothetical protein